MQRVVYLLVYPLLWGIAKLPFWLFYKVSDIVFFILYYLVGYRKKVVLDNLKLAFPNKSEAALKKIRKASYRHLCDVFLEMLKLLTMSKETHQKRFVFTNV